MCLFVSMQWKSGVCRQTRLDIHATFTPTVTCIWTQCHYCTRLSMHQLCQPHTDAGREVGPLERTVMHCTDVNAMCREMPSIGFMLREQ